MDPAKKDITNPKIGLTMRQIGLGKTEWLAEKTMARNKTGEGQEARNEKKEAGSKKKEGAKK